jgi:prepilin-type N-terminal cleavage/methylation domain-containing protein
MRRERGFSLPELLVGMALGSLAVAGSLAAFAAGRSLLLQAQSTNRLHERALFLLSVLEPELQLAGGYGLAPAPSIRTDGVNTLAADCGRGLAQDLTQAVEVSPARWPLTCAASGGGWRAGTDVLIVRRAAVQPATPQRGRLQLLTSIATPAGSQLLAHGVLPDGMALQEGRTELRDLLVRCYYVAQRADGSDGTLPALRVKALTRYAGSPAFIDTEVLPGVSGFKVLLGYRPEPDAAVQFVAADALPDGAQPVAVQVQLQLTGHRTEVGVAAASHRLSLTRSINLRNTVTL